MCFSPEADLVAGVFVTAVGLDVCLHVARRRELLLLASVPLVLGVHQLVEVFVWWGLRGDVSAGIGRLAMWIYLAVAFVVLPVLVPAAILALEPTPRRRRRTVPFVVLGAVAAVLLGLGLLHGPVSVTMKPWHLAYDARLHYGVATTGVYVVAVCGALLVSGFRHIVFYGIGNFAVVVVLAALTASGFTSLWCVYAAVSTSAIALHARQAGPHPYENVLAERRAAQPQAESP